MDVAQWEIELGELAAGWAEVNSAATHQPVDLDAWTDRLVRMLSEMILLQEAGRWAAGPHDLMSIVGLNRWELAHSAALGWLCQPDAGHGLGASLLTALIEMTGPPVDLSTPVSVVLEDSREVFLPSHQGIPHELAGSRIEYGGPGGDAASLTRADVVVRGVDWTLVIEVKVDAGEQRDQAHRLYEGWKSEGDVRFIFLTRRGHRPLSIPLNLQKKWTALSWPDLRRTLEFLAGDANPRAVARPALQDYILTLRTTF